MLAHFDIHKFFEWVLILVVITITRRRFSHLDGFGLCILVCDFNLCGMNNNNKRKIGFSERLTRKQKENR